MESHAENATYVFLSQQDFMRSNYFYLCVIAMQLYDFAQLGLMFSNFSQIL